MDDILDRQHSSSSWAWKGIVRGLHIIKEHVAWKIGAPSILRTWGCKWVDGKCTEKSVIQSFDGRANDLGDEVLDFIRVKFDMG